jgi:hypothetical protein
MKYLNAQTILKTFLFLIVFTIVVGYSAFRFVDYMKGSSITFASPVNGSTVNSPFVDIKGSADRISYISLDGSTISTDKTGNFDQQLLLHPGYNALQVKVTDRFGRVRTKTLKLVYNDASQAPHNGFALNEKKTKQQNPS